MTKGDDEGANGSTLVGDELASDLVIMARETTRSANRPATGASPPPSRAVRAAVGILISVVGLVGLIGWSASRIEGRLVDDTQDRLSDLGVDPSGLTITFDGRHGSVTGRLPDGSADARRGRDLLVDGAASIEVNGS